jgi:hypothetical protein
MIQGQIFLFMFLSHSIKATLFKIIYSIIILSWNYLFTNSFYYLTFLIVILYY